MKTNQEFSRKKPQEPQKELGKDEALVPLCAFCAFSWLKFLVVFLRVNPRSSAAKF